MEVTKSIEERVIELYNSFGDIYELTYSSDVDEVNINIRGDKLDRIINEFNEVLNEIKECEIYSRLENLLRDLGIYLEIAKLEFEGNELTTTPSNLYRIRNFVRTNQISPKPIKEIIEEKSEQRRSIAGNYCPPKKYLKKCIDEYLNPNSQQNFCFNESKSFKFKNKINEVIDLAL